MKINLRSLKMHKQSSFVFCLSLLIMSAEGLSAQSFEKITLSNVNPQEQLILATATATTEEEKITPALQELNKAKEEFKVALQGFIQELQKGVETQTSANIAPLQNASVKLDKLMESHQYFNEILQNSELKNQAKLKSNSQNIGVILERFTKVIHPFKNGLNSAKVKQVQEYLGFFPRRNINPDFYGFYGQTSQEEIEIFIQDNQNKLAIQTKQLTEGINQELKKIKQNKETANLQNLEQQLKQLETENKTLKTEVGQLKNQSGNYWLMLTAVLLSVVSCLGILYLMFKHKEKGKLAPTKVYNLTTNDLAIIEEEMYEKIAQQFKEQMRLIESRFKSLEGTSAFPKNIQQFTPSSNVDQKLRVIATREQGLNNSEGNSTPKIINPYDLLVNDYNCASEELMENAMEVNPINLDQFQPTDDHTLPQEILFKKQKKGQYWIIKVDNFYYLVPKVNMLITKVSHQSLQNFFECYGYKAGFSTKIQLLKPARVSVIQENQEWEFIQKGVIQFA